MVRTQVDADKVTDFIVSMYVIATNGCSNHGCLYNPIKGGMRTNSICRCSKEIEYLNNQLKGMFSYGKETDTRRES